MLAGAAQFAVACAGGGGSVSDGGGDTDGDVDCGEVDAICCEAEPYCIDGTTPVGDGAGGCECYLVCEPAMCTDDLDLWEEETVACGDVSSGGGIGACFSDEDMEPVDECTTETCTTASGYTDGICLSDAVNAYCMRQCTPDNDVCDIAHSCAALIDGEGNYAGGACFPS
jgi:hypothetical protein